MNCVMQLNVTCLNTLNIATLSIYTRSNYDVWWKHDGFDHDVTSIKLGYPPIYKWILPLWFTRQYTKSISTSSHISFILNALATSIVNGGFKLCYWSFNEFYPIFLRNKKIHVFYMLLITDPCWWGVKCRE